MFAVRDIFSKVTRVFMIPYTSFSVPLWSYKHCAAYHYFHSFIWLFLFYGWCTLISYVDWYDKVAVSTCTALHLNDHTIMLSIILNITWLFLSFFPSFFLSSFLWRRSWKIILLYTEYPFRDHWIENYCRISIHNTDGTVHLVAQSK